MMISIFVLLLAVALMIALYPLHLRRWTLLISTPVLFLILSSAYWYWGSWPQWNQYLQHQSASQKIQAVLQSVRSPQELIDKLRLRLNYKPESARGWYLLGRLYSSQHQWELARDAYAWAQKLNPADEMASVYYAQSEWELNHQQFNKAIRLLFQAILQKNENQPDAMAMLAMDAFKEHDYQLAINYWQRLLQQAPAGSDEAQAIRQAIAKAQRSMSANKL